MIRPRLAVIGAGAFGRHHLRVIRDCPDVELAAAVDIDEARAVQAATEFGCEPLTDWRQVPGKAEAAVVAVPTVLHADIACGLLDAGLDVLVEKPIAPDLAAADRILRAAESRGRIVGVGHLERFNPAVLALRRMITVPLFFEIHRMNLFSPRSLDVDVVLDLMVHDIDLVLALSGLMPEEVRAAGIHILSGKVDIAHVRLAFPGGCVANLTASRVSTERVRKLRLFQPHQYISIDYARQDGAVFTVGENNQIASKPLTVEKREPLALQLADFAKALRDRRPPAVSGQDGRRALQVALEVLDRIETHRQVVESHLLNRFGERHE
jgi:predicted dehydrogenase